MIKQKYQEYENAILPYVYNNKKLAKTIKIDLKIRFFSISSVGATTNIIKTGSKNKINLSAKGYILKKEKRKQKTTGKTNKLTALPLFLYSKIIPHTIKIKANNTADAG